MSGDLNLQPNTLYYFQLRAVNTTGGITTSQGCTFTTVANSASVAAAPVNPSVSTTTTASTASTGSLAYQPFGSTSTRLVRDRQTYYLIQNNIRYGITSLGILYSNGFTFGQAVPVAASDLSLPEGPLLSPADGTLVKSRQYPTVYLISGQQRHSFTSAKVFTALGYKFSSVLLVTNPELQALPKGSDIFNAQTAHLPGTDINALGTIYWIDSSSNRETYPDLAIYNSWHIKNDFAKVVRANSADLQLPIGSPIVARRIQ